MIKIIEKQKCLVCFEKFYSFELKKLKCGHIYDFNCYNQFKYTNKCPYCRQDIFINLKEIVIECYNDIKNSELPIQDSIKEIISKIFVDSPSSYSNVLKKFIDLCFKDEIINFSDFRELLQDL